MKLTKKKIKAITGRWNALNKDVVNGTLDIHTFDNFSESKRYICRSVTENGVDYIITTEKKANRTYLEDTVAIHTDEGFKLATIEELKERLRG